MEIQNSKNIVTHIENPTQEAEVKKSTPAFRGVMPAMNAVGGFMQGIENGGFLLSFLIQDFLGMTIPRTSAGFLRDRDVTGKYNVQEGFEVLGREGLTGPCMMAVAPISLIIAAKCGKSTSVNSQLIKRFGNSLKEIVASKNFDRAILRNKDKFKEEFYRNNIRKILEQSVGKENTSEKSVEYILKQLKNYEDIPKGLKLPKWRGKAKYKQHCINNITKHIDNIRYSTSSDLNMLAKVKYGSENLKDQKVFSTKNTFDAMIKYADDAITANKHIDKLDEAMAESIKNKSLGKRIVTNILMVASTLGILSVLPKIYARSNVAPGARRNQPDNTQEQNNVAFKGKGGNTKGLLEKLGEILNKNKSDFISSELEYNGHNFTNTLMAGLSLFGLITPRGLRAYNRAQKDENGKKDLTEIWEILLRDVTSSLAVVFAVPMLTRACVTSYENKTGFVLMQKERGMSKWKTFLDVINPYSKTHVLTNAEITNLYNGINTKEKMVNFCKYIDKNGGDLEKILSKLENASKVFTDETLNLQNLKGKTKAEKNQQIISFAENLEKHAKKLGKTDKEGVNKIVKELMRNANSGKNNITKFARGLNSMPAVLATLFISPYILGWAIPRLTYKNTRRIHAKQDKEREQKLKANA